MIKHITLLLTDMEYRTLVRMRRSARRKERNINRALRAADTELKAKHADVSRKDLITHRRALADNELAVLQTLHEIDLAMRAKRGDPC